MIPTQKYLFNSQGLRLLMFDYFLHDLTAGLFLRHIFLWLTTTSSLDNVLLKYLTLTVVLP